MVRLILVAATSVLVASGCRSVTAETVPIAVHFKLTDADYRPLADVPVRIAFSSDPDWQQAGAGHAVTTDASGEARFTVQATIDRGVRRVPSLSGYAHVLSAPLPYAHIRVAAELAHAGASLLYVVDASSFDRGGEVALDDFVAYAPDAHGRYTHAIASRQNDDGTIVAAYGYTVFDYLLAPPRDAGDTAWTLELAFKALPEPVRID